MGINTVNVFVNERINVNVEQGAKGGPGFLTTVLPLISGKEKRNAEWEFPRQSWNLGYGIQSGEDMDEIRAFFYVCFGKASGFRFKDWTDYYIGFSAPQLIGTGDGAATTFQAYRKYTVGAYTFYRKITRLVAGTISVYVNGVLKTVTTHYTVNVDTGIVTFTGGNTPPMGQIVAMQAQFDVPVRFDIDKLDVEVTWVGAQSAPNIPIMELKE